MEAGCSSFCWKEGCRSRNVLTHLACFCSRLEDADLQMHVQCEGEIRIALGLRMPVSALLVMPNLAYAT